MAQQNASESAEGKKSIHRFTTRRRTITETDIVNFVCLVGLHEPVFIDMEWIKENMPEEHWRRFAPAPLVMSVAMGLVAPIILDVLGKVTEGEKVGRMGGLTGVVLRARAPVYPGDTLVVEGEAWLREKTSKGYILIDIRHNVKNQKGELVVDFVETIVVMPPTG